MKFGALNALVNNRLGSFPHDGKPVVAAEQ